MRVAVLLLAACAAQGVDVGEAAPATALPDVNPASPTHGDVVAPADHNGALAVWYFGHANCPYCSRQFGALDALHDRLVTDGVDVAIVGINAADLEAHNDTILEGRDLPWLQDAADVDAWGAWGAVWRDAFLLDEAGVVVERRNLTDFDLTEDDNLASYEALLRGD